MHDIYAVAAAPLLVVAVGYMAEGLKGVFTYCITLTGYTVVHDLTIGTTCGILIVTPNMSLVTTA